MANLESLFKSELINYPKAAENYKKLEQVETKEISFGDYSVYIHFNPARAVSSLAKLDAKSIAERPCFLCTKNRPTEQSSIDYKGLFDICINPFPICNKHFTIISKKHELQRLNNEKIDIFYNLASEFKGWVVLYNGAKSGASAPDHFHFQVVNADYFTYPIETPMPGLINKISFSSQTADESANKLKETLLKLSDGKWLSLESGDPTDSCEPQINLFCEFKNGLFITTVFPRNCHRPRQFYEDESTRLMISPGAIDMTGHLIVARREDFEKINKEVLIDVYNQVSRKI
ncbi:MAG: DUF4922 domain-containing protein [Paludibacteraceae bacterium]|nr:DUF4922 domain-containing protein [Paludibacteraceae bacterium]MBO7368498.1 DUF4922 domain-containing protein [Paludibacteraceae bacterium]